jgi:DNA polymerase III alpha subunit
MPEPSTEQTTSAPAAAQITPPAAAQATPEPPFVLAQDGFVHLHAHSHYSILDGLNDPYTLLRGAGNLGQPALAITDHGRLSGVVEFWDAAVWYNTVHAERHSLEDCEKAKADGKHPRHKDALNCHPVAACRALARCPKKGSPAPDGIHGSLPPFKAILGIETYVADLGRLVRDPKAKDYGHLVLLAYNDVGWANLRALASDASTEGFYSFPRTDMEMLAKYGEGLLAMSACLGGHVAKTLKSKGPEAADELIRTYQKTLGADNFYLEIQWHNDQDLAGEPRAHEQHDLNRYLLGAAARTGARLVMANDFHYLKREDAVLEEIVLANQQNLTLAELAEKKAAGVEGLLGFDTPDFYLKTRREMQGALANWLAQSAVHDPEIAEVIKKHGKSWLDETLVIADRVTLAKPFITDKLHFPKFPIPDDFLDATIADAEARELEGSSRYLANMVEKRALEHYPKMNEKTKRLVDYELQCVQELSFGPYFLITADFVDFAKDQGVVNQDPPIDVGLGRGSAPGSVVTYVLGITDADPIHYGLTEGGIGLTRFLNPIVGYHLDPDTFGVLPEPYRSELAAILVSEQVEEIKAALNERAVQWGRSLKELKAANPVTGEVYSEDRQHLLLANWPETRTAMLDEWETIKKFGLTEVLWRWLRYRRSGADAVGDRNDCKSLIAGFLGLTKLVVPLMDNGTPFLPKYKFTQSRRSMPDIDIDFTPGEFGRERVMRYIVEKYGRDHVCQIATFGKMLAKSAIADVARAKGLSQQEGMALKALVPKKFEAQGDEQEGEEQIPGVSLHEMMTNDSPAVVEGSREMKAAMAADPKVDEIIRLAARLEGMIRSKGTHACGVLITPGPVTDYVAIERVAADKGTGVQAVFDGKTLTDILNLLKVDFLGIKNLPINRACVERIRERQGGDLIDWRHLPDNDPAAMELLRQGRTLGIFQFGKQFATSVIKQMKPKTVQDMMVATALGRPGPSAYIGAYIEARSKGTATYGDPVFGRLAGPVLADTYGILVYQEQVMRLSIEMSGFSLTESDDLRKATAKKDAAKLASLKDKFIDGAVARGVGRPFLENWWVSTLEPFASYSFNRSHATVYALMAYKQAWLKAHHLPEFMAALMTVDQNEGAKTTKAEGGIKPLAEEIVEGRRAGLEMRPIDINKSTDRIEIEDLTQAERAGRKLAGKPDLPALRLSMVATKGIGMNPVHAIMAERKRAGLFTSFADFLSRTIEQEREVDPATGRKVPNSVNKTVIENLIKVGAFDAFDDRAALLGRTAAYFGTTSVRKRAEVDWSPQADYDPKKVVRPKEYLDWEHELLGVYTSAHPADSLPQEAIDAFTAEQETIEARQVRGTAKDPRPVSAHLVSEVLEHDRVRDDTTRIVAGVVNAVEWKANKVGTGGRMIGRLEDATGGCRFTYWKPRDTDSNEEHKRFKEFKLAVEEGRLIGEGLIIAGGFSFNDKWNKEPELQVERWVEVALPRVELPPILVAQAAAKAAKAKPSEAAIYAPTDKPVDLEAIADLFGPANAPGSLGDRASVSEPARSIGIEPSGAATSSVGPANAPGPPSDRASESENTRVVSQPGEPARPVGAEPSGAASSSVAPAAPDATSNPISADPAVTGAPAAPKPDQPGKESLE